MIRKWSLVDINPPESSYLKTNMIERETGFVLAFISENDVRKILNIKYGVVIVADGTHGIKKDSNLKLFSFMSILIGNFCYLWL